MVDGCDLWPRSKKYINDVYQETYKDVRSTDYGLELHRDDPPDKYEWSADKDGGYKLNIKNPTVKEAGRYQLVVRIEKETYTCGAMLEVSGKYLFVQYRQPKCKWYCTVLK